MLELDSLGQGLCWDTSDLDCGILRVASATAIATPETQDEQVIYDLLGRRVTKITNAGIYMINRKKVVIK